MNYQIFISFLNQLQFIYFFGLRFDIFDIIYNLLQGGNSMALLGSCRPAGLAFRDREWVEIKARKVGLGIPWLGNQQGVTFGHQSKKKE